MEKNESKGYANTTATSEELGISVPDPDYGCVRVAPEVGLLGRIEGSIRIPGGLVHVSWNNAPECFHMEVTVPVGIHLSVRLPARRTDLLFIDREPIAEDTQTVRTDNYVDLAILPGSLYVFEVIPAPIQ